MMMAMCAGSRSKLTWRTSVSSGWPAGIHARSSSRDIAALMIVHPDQEQPARGRRRARVAARAAGYQIRHRRHRAPPAANLDEGADDGAHHVAEEPVAGDFIPQEAVAGEQLGPRKRAHRAAGLAARALKRGKV